MNEQLELITPGGVLLEEFLIPLDISQNKLSRDLDIPVSRVNNIINGKTAITADMALRLARYFQTTPELWINLQSNHALEKTKLEKWDTISKNIRPAKHL